ncbi:hypothetical protein K488DRAFT_92410 [Vararia minispora EC-137]|uniref:Uncharacterized protein n=1 Tax=Vararia minispora EC-137 TaxID=1314806 RepID=A0ACB8Q4X8_9AGAM|nr:hypothetical protein K488DRAFT_92410 [Vararia minispora EC-137]
MSSRFYAKRKKPWARSQADKLSTADPDHNDMPTEPSKGAVNPGRRGRPPSIKSQEHRDWLEDRRPEYERSVQKGKKATAEFLSSTTMAFLEEFGWTSTRFGSYNGEEQPASGEGTDSAAQADVAQMAVIYKLACQKAYGIFWNLESTIHATQDKSAQSLLPRLLQSLLSQTKPLRRPKLVNVFRRSPRYTLQMRAECMKRWKEASGEGQGAKSDEKRGRDDTSTDSEDSDRNYESADSGSGKDDSREDRTAEQRKPRQRQALEGKFLLEQLEASSGVVIVDIEQRAEEEYEEKVGERQAWLSEDPKTFEEAAAMMKTLSPVFENLKLVGWLAERGAYSAWYIAAPEISAERKLSVYTFLAGASPTVDGDADAPRLRLDQ